MGKTRDHFKKIRGTMGTFHAKTSTTKERNGLDLTEAEETKKRWQDNTELYKKGSLNDPRNHNSLITHLESDILECEVKWALGSISMNKASGDDVIPVELFQILKDDAVKVLHSMCHQIWETQQWSQNCKRSVSFQTQRKAMPKNIKMLHKCTHLTPGTFSSVQSLSHVQLFATPWTATCQASLSIASSWSLHKLMSIELVVPSNHLILCHPLLLLSSIFPNIRVFSNESALCVRWPKYWSFSFSIIPSKEIPGLIFRMD